VRRGTAKTSTDLNQNIRALGSKLRFCGFPLRPENDIAVGVLAVFGKQTTSIL
jgi:hypothetical protein